MVRVVYQADAGHRDLELAALGQAVPVRPVDVVESLKVKGRRRRW